MSTPMSMDFIHCTHCLNTNISNEIFCLTRCGRIYCQTCAHTGCLNCGPNECQIHPLVNSIGDDMKTYFKDTKTLIADVLRAVLFQRSQRIYLIQGLTQKIRCLENEKSELISREKLFEKRIQSLESENEKLKKKIYNQSVNPFEVSNIENCGNSTPSASRKADLSAIFGLRYKNETQTNPNQSLFASTSRLTTQSSNQPSMRSMSNKPSKSVLFQTPTHQRIRLGKSGSLLSRESLHSSQLRQKPTNNSYTPMSTNSTDSHLWRPMDFTRTPSSFSTLSSMSFGVKPNKQKVIHKVTPLNRY